MIACLPPNRKIVVRYYQYWQLNAYVRGKSCYHASRERGDWRAVGYCTPKMVQCWRCASLLTHCGRGWSTQRGLCTTTCQLSAFDCHQRLSHTRRSSIPVKVVARVYCLVAKQGSCDLTALPPMGVWCCLHRQRDIERIWPPVWVGKPRGCLLGYGKRGGTRRLGLLECCEMAVRTDSARDL